MFFHGVATATPPHKYTQKECWEAYCRSPYLSRLSGRSHAILRKVLNGDSGIDTRHFVMANLEEAFSYDPNQLHRRFSEHAPGLAAEAARNAIELSGLRVSDIDGLVITTCTGYLCPGLTSYVSELLGLNPRIYLADLVGHGCGAALPNLQTANALIASGQAKHVLCISVEVCSAAFYIDNDPGVLISTCLFGDGAAAAIVGKDPGTNLRPIEWKAFSTILNPKDRELLRFECRDGMLRNLLDKSVPVLVVEHLREALADLFAQSGKSQNDISQWILHSGGRDVLAAIQGALSLPAEKLCWTSEVLRQYGNMSSPSVLFALEKALNARAPGGTWLMSSFGAGITCHGALLDVQER
jgi:predicted naringenin-chalcone synthase